MPRVVHFEFWVKDPERAAKFYEEVFGWKVNKWEGPVDYWLVMTGEEDEPGIDGGLAQQEPGGATYVTIDVPSVDEFIEKIVAAGGRVDVPKQAVPGVGYLAYCADPEGVVFGLMEADPSAK